MTLYEQALHLGGVAVLTWFITDMVWQTGRVRLPRAGD